MSKKQTVVKGMDHVNNFWKWLDETDSCSILKWVWHNTAPKYHYNRNYNRFLVAASQHVFLNAEDPLLQIDGVAAYWVTSGAGGAYTYARKLWEEHPETHNSFQCFAMLSRLRLNYTHRRYVSCNEIPLFSDSQMMEHRRLHFGRAFIDVHCPFIYDKNDFCIGFCLRGDFILFSGKSVSNCGENPFYDSENYLWRVDACLGPSIPVGPSLKNLNE